MDFSKLFKKGVFIISILLLVFNSYSQDTSKSNFQFKSWSITPLEAYGFPNRTSEMFSGILPLSISMDLTCSLSNNLISISGSYGEETGIFGGSAHYNQISLLYGREFELEHWFLVETHLGAGMFSYGSSDLLKNVSEFAIPVIGKLRFQTGDKFSIGLRLTYIFNSFSNLYSAGILLQWNY